MTESKYIAGAGGGGGGGGKGGGGGRSGGGSSTPTEQDDSLQSKQFGQVLDLISEGEIEGLDDGNKSVFLDGTPIQDSSGNNNFSGFTVVTRSGTQAQTYIPGDFGNVENEVTVGVEVTNASSVTRQITDTNVNRARITITVPSLQRFEDDGDIVGTSVSLNIQVQYNGAVLTQSSQIQSAAKAAASINAIICLRCLDRFLWTLGLFAALQTPAAQNWRTKPTGQALLKSSTQSCVIPTAL